MNNLLNKTRKQILIYAGIVLALSIPAYYIAINLLWQYEMAEHHIILTPEDEREDKFLIIGAVMLLTVLFFVLLLVGIIVLNRRIAKRLWQPFYKSLDTIRHFNLDKQRNVHFEKTDIAEFESLNQSLHKLIAGSIAAYEQQKQFADHASHELQTPLAIVQSKLDMLLQSQSLTNEQYHIIEEALQALTRVNRINQNLLLLTRIENSQFMEKEQVDLSGLLTGSVLVFRSITGNRQIAATIVPGVVVEGNKILVEVLVNNLITNAIRHGSAGNAVNIELSAAALVISNSGGVALQPAQLFKRFATASSEKPGTGLGLALVKQICDRYGWEIKYGFEEGLHVFRLVF